MIICDYINGNVKKYLKGKSGKTIITLFKEPFSDYNGSKVFFVDDILNESDYRKIDGFVNHVIEVSENLFSNYLNIRGYNLFRYLQLEARRNLSKVHKYRYAVDKVAKKENATNIVFFSSGQHLLEYLRQNYRVKNRNRSTFQQIRARMKSKIKTGIKNSSLINYIIDSLFKDGRKISVRILWLGGRSINSKLPHEIKKDFKISLLQNHSAYKLRFIIRGLKYDLLKLKDSQEFNKEWNYVKQQYSEGLTKIAVTVGLRTELLELILRINRNKFKQLLLSLCILEDNKHNLDLLLVQQSVIGVNVLAVDYFNRHGLPSLELLHGIPCRLESGNTTKVAVYGQRDKIFLSNHGVDKTKIVTTGCPDYDNFFEFKEGQKTSEFLLLILDWILLTPSSRSHREVFEQVMNMFKLLQHLKSEQLVIKLHPTQSAKEMEYIQYLVRVTNLNKQVEVKRNVNITDLLKRAKIVFTHTTSVGVEALLMKKPLIVLDFFPNSKIEYEKYGGCMIAKNFQQLLMTTKQILKNVKKYRKNNIENVEKTRRYFSDDLEGKSYKKVADLCREMISKCIK